MAKIGNIWNKIFTSKINNLKANQLLAQIFVLQSITIKQKKIFQTQTLGPSKFENHRASSKID